MASFSSKLGILVSLLILAGITALVFLGLQDVAIEQETIRVPIQLK